MKIIQSRQNQGESISHRIHVWYIYIHLVDFYGKCRQIYHNCMDPMGMGKQWKLHTRTGWPSRQLLGLELPGDTSEVVGCCWYIGTYYVTVYV